ncbi:MAG TPA: MOSC domain-containing protein [Polyangiaceae bacterium]
MEELQYVEALAGRGLMGDVAARGRSGHKRQVTLMQEEHLSAVASLVDAREVLPATLRRNLVVAGVNLIALAKLRFAIGEAVLVGTGPCAPCGKLDEWLGPGGFQAMRGHGGICARIERSAVIRVGDPVRALGVADTE